MSARPMPRTMNVRARAGDWLNALNLHYAGVAVLALVNLYLLVDMGLVWQRAHSAGAEAQARQKVELRTAQIAARPLQGLDVKLAAARGNADGFYRERLPVSYSEVLTELGVLSKRQGVRLAHVNYGQVPVAGEGVSGEAAGQLTEVRMDASLSGQYRPLVLFLNGLERDKVFFVINGVTLTGQQTGMVSLRIRLATYLRGLEASERLEVGRAADEDSGGSADGGGAR